MNRCVDKRQAVIKIRMNGLTEQGRRGENKKSRTVSLQRLAYISVRREMETLILCQPGETTGALRLN